MPSTSWVYNLQVARSQKSTHICVCLIAMYINIYNIQTCRQHTVGFDVASRSLLFVSKELLAILDLNFRATETSCSTISRFMLQHQFGELVFLISRHPKHDNKLLVPFYNYVISSAQSSSTFVTATAFNRPISIITDSRTRGRPCQTARSVRSKKRTDHRAYVRT